MNACPKCGWQDGVLVRVNMDCGPISEPDESGMQKFILMGVVSIIVFCGECNWEAEGQRTSEHSVVANVRC